MKGQTNSKIIAYQLQRTLRKNPTDAERAIWQALRGKQFNGHKFRRQHPFESFILDFVCVEAKLVIEIDGGQHADNHLHDQKRTMQLEQAGFTVLRFWNNQVLTEMESVKQAIWCVLDTHPHPNPPLEREGTKEENRPNPRTHPNPPLEREGTKEENRPNPRTHPNPPLEPSTTSLEDKGEGTPFPE